VDDLIQKRDSVLESQGEGLGCTMEPRGSQEPARGVLPHQTGKNLGTDIRPAPKWQKGRLITSQSHLSNFEQK
jgi:hypothetical protein